MSNSKRNFYEILNSNSCASFNELKSNYKELILQYHPDKLQQQLDIKKNSSQMNDQTNNLEFVAITEAWNCLKDPVKRKQYDAELLLNKFHTHNNIYAHIKFTEMKKQTNTGNHDEEAIEQTDSVERGKCEEVKHLYTYDCRCGGQYIVDDSVEQYCRSGNNLNSESNNNDDNVGHDDDANKQSVSGKTIQHRAGAESEDNDDDDNNDQDNIDAEVGSELIVECSECSLVIILNG